MRQLFLRRGSDETIRTERSSFQRFKKLIEAAAQVQPSPCLSNRTRSAGRRNFYVSRLEMSKTGRMPIMGHDDIIAWEIPTQRDPAFAAGAPADQQRACNGAMMQQGFGHGLQSWPQQFIRLVGGHRRPAPVQSTPVQN
jgi:hypothetical protein